jgi:hypothetical protein
MRSHDPVCIVQGSIISASVKFWVRVGQPSSSKQTGVESSTASQERAFDPSVLENFQRLIKCHFNCPLNIIKSERREQDLNYTHILTVHREQTNSRFLQDSSPLLGIMCEHRR